MSKALSIELWATNTGSLYKRHCTMARNSIRMANHMDVLGTWVSHVHNTVLPLYRAEVEPVAYSAEMENAVATALRVYYERHVREGGCAYPTCGCPLKPQDCRADTALYACPIGLPRIP